MITGRLTVIRNAQDLEGRYWLCPVCNIEVLIGSKGIDHHCREKRYWAIMNLEQIWEGEQAYKAARERERKLLFK
jgi:hypothetical protein